MSIWRTDYILSNQIWGTDYISNRNRIPPQAFHHTFASTDRNSVHQLTANRNRLGQGKDTDRSYVTADLRANWQPELTGSVDAFVWFAYVMGNSITAPLARVCSSVRSLFR